MHKFGEVGIGDERLVQVAADQRLDLLQGGARCWYISTSFRIRLDALINLRFKTRNRGKRKHIEHINQRSGSRFGRIGFYPRELESTIL